MVKNGSIKPEDWEPVETSAEMIEMILATVNGLESMTGVCAGRQGAWKRLQIMAKWCRRAALDCKTICTNTLNSTAQQTQQVYSEAI